MNLIMKRPSTNAAANARRKFMGLIGHTPHGDLLDLDFDNDNDKPLTAEHLDWHLGRQTPRLT